MRLIKMLGLAMVAAIATMAFVAAGSASATGPTGLCTLHPSSGACPDGMLLTGLQNIDGLQILGDGVLLTSLGQIHCKGGHIKAHIPSANLSATTILGTINEFVYLTCEALLVGCNGKPAAVKTTVTPEFHLLYTEANLGTLSILKPSTEVEIKCGGLVGTKICKFAENDTVTGTVHNLHEGLLLPYVKFNKSLITGPGGGVCPNHGELDTNFELNYLDGDGTLLPVYISE